MKLLDLFCGAGGASVGYARAGFEVVGVDIEPHPDYPFEMHVADALTFPLEGFDAIHASPTCQLHSLVSLRHGHEKRNEHPELIAPTRARLEAETTVPYVIENVEGAPLRRDLVLCGEMFGLRLHRHRVFEVGRFFIMRLPHPRHALKGAQDNSHVEDGYTRQITGHYADHASASAAMGIDWMNREDLPQAIPPAYTEFIGEALMREVRHRAENVAT